MSDQQDAEKTSTSKVNDKAITSFENLIVQGNLAGLTSDQRIKYYQYVCQSLGINYLTRPFEYITVQGKMILYARRDATDQLRKIHQVAIKVTARERFDDVYVVTAQASTADGRTDEAIGAVSLIGLRGTDLANALMKAETKAKRRVTLSIVGLGWSDETEIESLIEGFGKSRQAVQAIAPARKFADLTEEEKRKVLTETWNTTHAQFTEKWPEADVNDWLPLCSFLTDPIDYLFEMTKLFREVVRQEKLEDAVDIRTKMHELFQAEMAKGKDNE